ncbi:hypothetical protein AB1K62_14345 [Parasphingorhabdus sp. JC815]|uniref:hypothetical protein n=1 Tax=Parasphingorhabdus sp. JC815 TaxID=3232140 RepID=UPI0034598519
MDFDLLDLRTAAGKEYWVHLRLGNTLLYLDMDKEEKPCRVKVASSVEPGVEDATKAVMRAGRMFQAAEDALSIANRDNRAALEKRLDQLERESEKCLTAFLVKAIKGWENIEQGGKELKFSPEALEDLAQPKGPLFRMAATIAEDSAKAQSPFAKADSA